MPSGDPLTSVLAARSVHPFVWVTLPRPSNPRRDRTQMRRQHGHWRRGPFEAGGADKERTEGKEKKIKDREGGYSLAGTRGGICRSAQLSELVMQGLLWLSVFRGVPYVCPACHVPGGGESNAMHLVWFLVLSIVAPSTRSSELQKINLSRKTPGHREDKHRAGPAAGVPPGAGAPGQTVSVDAYAVRRHRHRPTQAHPGPLGQSAPLSLLLLVSPGATQQQKQYSLARRTN